MSWLFSRALVEEYLVENFSDGEQSVPSNGNPIPQAYLPQDKMTKFSRLSRFGMTFKPLPESRGEELLTLYLEDFHARTYPLQEKAMDLTENEAECGEKWQGSFAKYDPSTHSLKTHQCSLFEDSTEFCQTLPAWGLMRNGECWEQQMLAHPIKETVFGFMLPTPVASDGTTGSVIGKNDTFYTTSTGMPRKVNQNGIDGSVGLGRLVQMWPTPVTRDYKDTGTKESMTRQLNKRQSPGLALVVGAETGGKLNPTWTEWLMGWPLEWTELKPLETDKCHCVQQPLGEF
jgi:hypothetical protein